jgi:acetyltransferase-like isoleucine patch superfamily enzyme
MLFAGLGPAGRLAMRIAGWFTPRYRGRRGLAGRNRLGYIAPTAVINERELRLGPHVFIDDGVIIHQDSDGGPIELGERTHLWRDNIIQTGAGGSITIGKNTHIQPRCVFSAFKGSIRIGSGVQIAPNCGFYPYDHGMAPGLPIGEQPLQSRGDIVIDDDAWLGFGVVVLSGVRIGRGAAVGAGSVVTHDIPDEAIAAGVPARVIRMRNQTS